MATFELDGVPVGYLQEGDGPAPPLLCLHGFTGSKEDFAPVLPGLARSRRVVALDFPGHGDSVGPDDPDAYELSRSAAWVLRAADALDLGEHHLLGHSMGGLVAQRVAAAASHRLRSLILMGSGLGALRDDAAELLAPLARIVREEGLEAAYDAIRAAPRAKPGPEPEVEAFMRRRFLALNPAAVIGGVRNLTTAMPLGAFLRGIDMPVLVIHGEKDDAWTPAEQGHLAREIRGARLEVVPDCYHSPQAENPEAWLAVVEPFLARADR